MPVLTRAQLKYLSVSTDIKRIKELFSGSSETAVYWDIYQDFRNQAWNTGNFDTDYCLLDKWVWKYRDYTVKQIRTI